jgi:hypothetical protein
MCLQETDYPVTCENCGMETCHICEGECCGE